MTTTKFLHFFWHHPPLSVTHTYVCICHKIQVTSVFWLLVGDPPPRRTLYVYDASVVISHLAGHWRWSPSWACARRRRRRPWVGRWRGRTSSRMTPTEKIRPKLGRRRSEARCCCLKDANGIIIFQIWKLFFGAMKRRWKKPWKHDIFAAAGSAKMNYGNDARYTSFSNLSLELWTWES